MSEELPRGWCEATLGHVADYINGAAFKPEDWHGDGVPIIRIQNLTDPTKPLNRAKRKGDPRLLIRRGDLLFSWSATLDAFIWDREDAWLSQHIFKVVPRRSLIEPAFAYHRLRYDVAALLGSEHLLGSTMRHINLGSLLAHRISLPPLAEQRRIVARIEALFARIRQARADLLRVGPLARHLRDRTLVNAFDASWPEVAISDLAVTTFDGPFGSNLKSSDYAPSGTRVVRLENIGHLNFINDKESYIPTDKGEALSRHTLEADDVLFSSFVDKEVRVCRLPSDLAGTTINKADCVCVRVDTSRALPAFVEKRLASPDTYEDMRERVHGATRPRIGLGDLKAYRIGLPSLETQMAIVGAIDVVHEASKRFEHEATRALALLDHLERSILTRAFRGELVPQDPADQPAAVTLASVGDGAPTTPRRGRPRRAA